MGLKENLKRIRKNQKITQRELAELTGISFSMISKLESGEQANPSLETISKIAGVLKVQPFELLTNLDLEKIRPIVEEVDRNVKGLLERPEQIVHDAIHNLLISEAGTEVFNINHEAISPDELELIENSIKDFIMFQFSKYQGKTSIYKT